MNAAFYRSRKIMLAALEAAHVDWRDNVVNPAISQLNAATPTDSGLVPLANILTDAVLKINLYHPELDRLIAETNALLPSDPPAPVVITTQTQTQKLACPEGQTGQITQQRIQTTTDGVVTYSDWMTTENTCGIAPPPVVTPPGAQSGVTIIPHPAFPSFAQGMKHVTAAFHPPSGRIYYVGGDYRGFDHKYEQSYQQETGSFDMAIILSQGPNAPDAFRLEYSYEGYGTVQLKHPDFVSIDWDESRSRYWIIPGQTQNAASNNAPGETASGTDDPSFKYGIFTFDPAKPLAERYRLVTSDYGTGAQETWMSVRDALNDRFIRPGVSYLNFFDCKTEKWIRGGGAVSASGEPENWYQLGDGTLRINKEYIAKDLVHRKFYAIDPVKKRVFCVSMDFPHVTEDCGEQPGPPITTQNKTYLLYNSKHDLLEFNNEGDGNIYVADASVRPLVWKIGARGISCRAAVYDPKNDGSMWFGGNDEVNGGGLPNMHWFKAMESAVFL